jgi:LmbE family N-acetylglucosaminyl deacetylase
MASRTLAVCVAHPDDEAYGLYGSVALHSADPSFRLAVLHATDGDAGEIAPGVDVTRGMLGAFRRAEDERGWRAIGHVPDRHDWLGHPDGRLDGVPFGRLVDEVTGFLVDVRPDVVVTFGPDGATGHPDHIAIGRATDEAFHRVRADGGPGLRRLLHGCMPQGVVDRLNAHRLTRHLPMWDPQRVYDLRGVPDEEIGVRVITRSVAGRVVAGLVEHRSQRHVLFDDPSDDEWGRAIRREFHAIAWPPRPSGAPVLRDIFESLD